MFGWPRKSRSTSGTEEYWWLCLMNFWNCFTIYVFEGEESFSGISTELPCFGDLENPGQLPVKEVLESTDDSFIWSFEMSSIFMFSRSRNSLLAFLLSYSVRVISEIQVNSRYRGTQRYWWLCLIHFWHFFTIYVFEVKQPNFDISTELPCSGNSKIQVNFRFRRYWWFCLIDFWNFLYSLGFRGQRIHCLYSYWATSFGWSRKSGSTSGSRGFWGHPNKEAQ